MRRFFVILIFSSSVAAAAGPELNCDFAGYKAQDGLKSQMRAGMLEVTWQGDRRDQLRAVFSIRNRQPLVHELAVRKEGGDWVALGADLTPEFQITRLLR